MSLYHSNDSHDKVERPNHALDALQDDVGDRTEFVPGREDDFDNIGDDGIDGER